MPITAARARGIDVVLADTAGRLPTQGHLMEELKKIRRVLGKAQDGAPHETLLVIDANTGQNTLAQVKAFDAALTLTGLIVTKLDGTAKGGVVAAIAGDQAGAAALHRRGGRDRGPASLSRRGVRGRAAAASPPHGLSQRILTLPDSPDRAVRPEVAVRELTAPLALLIGEC